MADVGFIEPHDPKFIATVERIDEEPLQVLIESQVLDVTLNSDRFLEAFKEVAAIAVEKASILDGLEPGGVAVLNADIDTATILAAKAADRRLAHNVRIDLGVSEKPRCHARFDDSGHDQVGTNAVRAQLTRVYAKAGVSNRTQLLAVFTDDLLAGALPGLERRSAVSSSSDEGPAPPGPPLRSARI